MHKAMDSINPIHLCQKNEMPKASYFFVQDLKRNYGDETDERARWELKCTAAGGGRNVPFGRCKINWNYDIITKDISL